MDPDYLLALQLSFDDEDNMAQLYGDENDGKSSTNSNIPPSNKEESNDDGDKKPAATDIENDNFEFESVDVSSHEDEFEQIDKIVDGADGIDENTDESFEFVFPEISSIDELNIDYIEQCSSVNDLQHIVRLLSSTSDSTKTNVSQDLINTAVDRLRTLQRQNDNEDFVSTPNQRDTIDEFSMEFIEQCRFLPDLQRCIYSLERIESGNTKQCRDLIKAATEKIELLMSAPVFECTVDNYTSRHSEKLFNHMSEKEPAKEGMIDTAMDNEVSAQERQTSDDDTSTVVNNATMSADYNKTIDTYTNNYVLRRKLKHGSTPPLTTENLCKEIREYSKCIQELAVVHVDDESIARNGIPMKVLMRIFGIKKNTSVEKRQLFQTLVNRYCTHEMVGETGASKKVLKLKESVLDDLDDFNSHREEKETVDHNSMFSEKKKKPSVEYTVRDIMTCNSKSILQGIMRRHTSGSQLHESAKRRLWTLFPGGVKKLSIKSTIEDIENCNSIPDLRHILRRMDKDSSCSPTNPSLTQVNRCNVSAKSLSAEKRLQTLLCKCNVSQTQEQFEVSASTNDGYSSEFVKSHRATPPNPLRKNAGIFNPTTSGNICVTLCKPLEMTFEPVHRRNDNEHERGVRIRSMHYDKSAAAWTKMLAIGDELVSINGRMMSNLTFNEIMDIIIAADPKGMNLVFRRPGTQTIQESEDYDYALALSLSLEPDNCNGDENFLDMEKDHRYSQFLACDRKRLAKPENKTNISHELNVFGTHCEDEIEETVDRCFIFRDCDIQITKNEEPGQNKPLQRHPGNLWLEYIISLYAKTICFEKYFVRMKPTNPHMALIIQMAERKLFLETLQCIRNSGRRFFRLYEGLGVVWVDIDDKDAYDEIAFLFAKERSRERVQN